MGRDQPSPEPGAHRPGRRSGRFLGLWVLNRAAVELSGGFKSTLHRPETYTSIYQMGREMTNRQRVDLGYWRDIFLLGDSMKGRVYKLK